MSLNKTLLALALGLALTAGCKRADTPATANPEPEATVSKEGAETVRSESSEADANATVQTGRLYSLHDDKYNVRCWYILGSNGSWTISCLPDSVIVKSEEFDVEAE